MYFNWAEDEPSPQTNENYVHIYAKSNSYEIHIGEWNNTVSYCDGEHSFYSASNCGFICEWDIISNENIHAITPNNWKRIIFDKELDPNNGADTDNDSLPDWQEVNNELLVSNKDGGYDFPTLAELLTASTFNYICLNLKKCSPYEYAKLIKNLSEIKVVPIISDPTKMDSEGDGLLDGMHQYYNDKVMLPVDPHPLSYDGPEGVWNAQKKVVERHDISTEYGSDNDGENKLMNSMAENADIWVDILLKNNKILNKNLLNFIRKYFKGFAESETSTKAGADFLDFIYDKQNVAYHSQVDTWQKAFGYNDIYDKVFEDGSYMLRDKKIFSYNGNEYILWSWKGDYWNLQSGAETGLYVYNRTVNEVKHYDVVDFNLPMTLSLYNMHDGYTENIFSWVPDEPQWWITGFNPDFTEPDPNIMVAVVSINFTGYEEMYEAAKSNFLKQSHEGLIFDDKYNTIWMVW